ncbi:hypothetical protein PAPYR_9580 [Paratrimastix pyriformis]|uniref:Uncharacterized protein n=1 Tax=Paratrimastix pyriformis TaxID=342808 RepID=A0ABQ8UAW3_9EUKA|nr:hypothetical protein PAPYR_9580 [Paratrimastix pyriformis]
MSPADVGVFDEAFGQAPWAQWLVPLEELPPRFFVLFVMELGLPTDKMAVSPPAFFISVGGLVVEYHVAIVVTRVQFPADASLLLTYFIFLGSFFFQMGALVSAPGSLLCTIVCRVDWPRCLRELTSAPPPAVSPMPISQGMPMPMPMPMVTEVCLAPAFFVTQQDDVSDGDACRKDVITDIIFTPPLAHPQPPVGPYLSSLLGLLLAMLTRYPRGAAGDPLAMRVAGLMPPALGCLAALGPAMPWSLLPPASLATLLDRAERDRLGQPSRAEAESGTGRPAPPLTYTSSEDLHRRVHLLTQLAVHAAVAAPPASALANEAASGRFPVLPAGPPLGVARAQGLVTFLVHLATAPAPVLAKGAIAVTPVFPYGPADLGMLIADLLRRVEALAATGCGGADLAALLERVLEAANMTSPPHLDAVLGALLAYLPVMPLLAPAALAAISRRFGLA